MINVDVEALFPGGQWDPTHTKFLVMKGRYLWPAAAYDSNGDLAVTDFGRRFAKPIPTPEEGVQSIKRKKRY